MNRCTDCTDVHNIFKIKTLYTAFSQKLGSDHFFEGETHNFWGIVLVIDGEIGITAGSDVFFCTKVRLYFMNQWNSIGFGAMVIPAPKL